MEKLFFTSLLVAVISLSNGSKVFASSGSGALSAFKETCSEIGYTIGTEKFADCVLELRKRSIANSQPQNNVAQADANVAALEQLVKESQQRMALERQQYQQQLQAQKAAKERARQQAFWGAVTQFGLGMAGGQQPGYGNSSNTPTFQSIQPPKTMDGSCHSSCMGLGYSYGLCKSKCSY